MPWRTAERKVIGTVVISEEGAPPMPHAPPTPAVQAFLDEHRRLKKTLDSYGAKGMCVTRSTLEKEGRVSGDILDKHIDVFRAHSAISEVDGDILCGREALSKLKKKIRLEL